jgi:general secretion pathway protein G
MLRLFPTTRSPSHKIRAGRSSTDRPLSPLGQLGWTLVEMILALSIFATLLAIARPSVLEYVNQARIAKAIADIQAIQSDLAGPELLDGQLPATLAEIGWAGMVDPWGEPYEYLVYTWANQNDQRKDRFLKPINSSYDLYSKGEDGETQKQLNAPDSLDDIVRANDGAFIGLAAKF